MDTRQAKYDGQHPCAYGAQGKHRQTIVPVKRFPVNAWGLYEMHDKVWEWCADGQRPYDGADCDDPRAPEGEGDYWRVARGGSWLSRAWRLGLACRFEGHRDGRDGFLGFALRAISR
ncbi:MAG TPA: SUMF1/EgtB/PvdO family nonheme iron enzyme [Accumulibacter sp.]|uniref:formylglycine-generating enzyme family protein n=1 Tax=Accumulibacter sp. TaxID=2053492 RepID=UPI002BBC72A8|nr:SUMF1/EgtB/PvdO family nonheme iron enzyme [Accumulibacter sp.]HNL98501.1 SUMF1/EgtB/PvdO family nonheme iron enzyme [Accumulibacter sp.]